MLIRALESCDRKRQGHLMRVATWQHTGRAKNVLFPWLKQNPISSVHVKCSGGVGEVAVRVVMT